MRPVYIAQLVALSAMASDFLGMTRVHPAISRENRAAPVVRTRLDFADMITQNHLSGAAAVYPRRIPSELLSDLGFLDVRVFRTHKNQIAVLVHCGLEVVTVTLGAPDSLFTEAIKS